MRKSIFLAVVMAAPAAHGAEIKVFPATRENVGAVTIQGDIQSNEFEAFKAKASVLVGKHVVGLQSNGGNPIAAMQIGEFIRMRGWQTFVRNECYSSCALIWLAGATRAMRPDAQIGLHAVSLDGREIGSGNALVGAYLTQLGYGYDAVAFATTAEPDDIALLTPEKAKSFGIDVILDATPQQQVKEPVQTVMTAMPQAAVPAAPARTSLISTAKRLAEFTLNNLVAAWNAGDVERMAAIYANSVRYYGMPTSKSDVLGDKRKFMERWPNRNYTIRRSSLMVDCNDNALEITCIAQSLTDWDVTNAGKRLAGTASFFYTLTGQSRGLLELLVAAENSTVTSRNITDVGQQPAPQTAVTPQGYVSLKIWDTYLPSTKRYIRRELQIGPNSAYRLVATDHDAAGGSNGGSTCTFKASGWSDCVGTAGNHYQLKSESIRWFLNIVGGQQP